ncbi:MAG TPA: hypothetical protein VHU77_03560 [Candidatus Limnocylindria bacterium]|nr:hypothetical protein [Candidatus Limnocylindria bacterium]
MDSASTFREDVTQAITRTFSGLEVEVEHDAAVVPGQKGRATDAAR